MKSTASAPAKIILFGEHFIVYGGKAILCSINKRITVESEAYKDRTDRNRVKPWQIKNFKVSLVQKRRLGVPPNCLHRAENA
ncbi:hypothetical protein QVH35_05480 [Candidatus Nitrosotenuis chungbukensis]|uniref:hypothetical protein n=1 Tax=Candidatus Nitrosotenuis chungbukensis TaxID=1353246 RepID=UPI002672131A|nr:hypothetical protein [Candidatus Nitrosotenuis chungbukensis]WKT58775.1 hypothetical protein QVH35_05480 [Candidatus Nitrosotenuis chungbukensis]